MIIHGCLDVWKMAGTHFFQHQSNALNSLRESFLADQAAHSSSLVQLYWEHVPVHVDRNCRTFTSQNHAPSIRIAGDAT